MIEQKRQPIVTPVDVDAAGICEQVDVVGRSQVAAQSRAGAVKSIQGPLPPVARCQARHNNRRLMLSHRRHHVLGVDARDVGEQRAEQVRCRERPRLRAAARPIGFVQHVGQRNARHAQERAQTLAYPIAVGLVAYYTRMIDDQLHLSVVSGLTSARREPRHLIT